MSAPVPVTIIGGYLGAGKTTLVNHLLRHAGSLRLAVLVNDFGDLPIDADLIEARGEGVISIAGGCVCCSFGSDLMGALLKLAQLDPAPGQVLIETSGVALPGAVASAVRLVPGFALDAVAVLADAETVRERAADRYMGDTIEGQLAQADLIVLNKLDLVTPRERVDLVTWLAGRAPKARVIEAARAQVPLQVLLGSGVGNGSARQVGNLRAAAIQPPEDAASLYESVSFFDMGPLQVHALAQELARPELGLVRAKGVLRDAAGGLKVLQVVGARYEVTDAPGSPRETAGCVCIGLKGLLDRSGLDRLFERAHA
ncbi:MAG: GTP-binding protein [Betaproteobacteria bacterium]|nr:GTP-binding protein [Betaproteobacteria bacterium]